MSLATQMAVATMFLATTNLWIAWINVNIDRKINKVSGVFSAAVFGWCVAAVILPRL